MPIGHPNANRRAPLAVVFSLLLIVISLPALWQRTIPSVVLLSSVVLGLGLAALSAADVQAFRLPDALTLPLTGAGLLLTWLAGGSLLWRLVSAAAGFLLLYTMERAYQRVRGRSGLGRGDAKLFAASGAWLGAESLATVLVWACGTALIAVLLAGCFGKQLTQTTRLPFGPFLALGTWLAWFYGPLN